MPRQGSFGGGCARVGKFTMRSMKSRRWIACLFLLVLSGAALAQTFPSRSVTLVVPNPPGGAIDIQARIYAQKLQGLWGQPVIVDYKPGAGTLLGMEHVAKSAPDGHTLCLVVTPLVILPALREKMPYDTLKDLAPVTLTGVSSIMIAASPTMQAGNIAGELLKMEAGIDLLHVPFKGGAQAYPELMAGRIDLQLDPTFGIYRHVKAGKMKAIAVTSAKRDPSAPEVPAVAETLRGFDVLSINGIVAAGSTPRELARRISGDFRKLLREPDTAKRLEELGIEPVGNTPEEFGAFIKGEIERWTRVAKAANVKME